MKESNILAGIATIKQRQKEVFVNTKGQYMKELNILVSNVTIKQLQRAISLNIQGKHIKELDSHAGIVISNMLPGQIFQNTKEIYMYNIPF